MRLEQIVEGQILLDAAVVQIVKEQHHRGYRNTVQAVPQPRWSSLRLRVDAPNVAAEANFTRATFANMQNDGI